VSRISCVSSRANLLSGMRTPEMSLSLTTLYSLSDLPALRVAAGGVRKLMAIRL
jgi:hypothetical protein